MAPSATVSVVIPTLGGPTLASTITQLNCGSLVPTEILVCVPTDYCQKLELPQAHNLRLVATVVKGQVSQRLEGFKQAVGEYILQLDDDMFLDQNCLQYLVKTIRSANFPVSVSPALVSSETGESLYKPPQRSYMYHLIYYYLINGRNGCVPGSITASGLCIGVDPSQQTGTPLVPVEWLPGGCILHYHNNIISSNYYPYEGKAYGEDIIHSILMKEAGVRLVIDIEARCATAPGNLDFKCSTGRLIKEIWRIFMVRRYFLKLRKVKSVRVYVLLILDILYVVYNKAKLLSLWRLR